MTGMDDADHATLQTPAPLTRLPLTEGNEPVEQVVGYPALLLDPPYQRGSVWGTRRRRNLIRSLLRGVPTGAIYLNTRAGADQVWAVVDGRQRIETVQAFLTDQLSVPASWFPAADVDVTEETSDGPYVRWHGLSDVGRRRFARARLTTLRCDGLSVAQEAELFDLVNYGGLPQGCSDDDTEPVASPAATSRASADGGGDPSVGEGEDDCGACAGRFGHHLGGCPAAGDAGR